MVWPRSLQAGIVPFYRAISGHFPSDLLLFRVHQTAATPARVLMREQRKAEDDAWRRKSKVNNTKMTRGVTCCNPGNVHMNTSTHMDKRK